MMTNSEVLERDRKKIVHDTAKNRLRDEFAMAALQGILAGKPVHQHYFAEQATRAYEMADAMLKAREA